MQLVNREESSKKFLMELSAVHHYLAQMHKNVTFT